MNYHTGTEISLSFFKLLNAGNYNNL